MSPAYPPPWRELSWSTEPPMGPSLLEGTCSPSRASGVACISRRRGSCACTVGRSPWMPHPCTPRATLLPAPCRSGAVIVRSVMRLSAAGGGWRKHWASVPRPWMTSRPCWQGQRWILGQRSLWCGSRHPGIMVGESPEAPSMLRRRASQSRPSSRGCTCRASSGTSWPSGRSWTLASGMMGCCMHRSIRLARDALRQKHFA
mmetsp:Transcript_33627/g.96556  ORF Transcript_33627/g.96556 Transcript_33627/m.96556 type:complete len:202 (-) Transcript_33627:246-851(-)